MQPTTRTTLVKPTGQRTLLITTAGRLAGGPVVAVLLAMVLTLASLLAFSPQSAQAHDELISSNPATGATIEALPSAVELKLTNPPSGVGATIIVTDNTRTNWSDGPVSITNNIVTQPLRTGAPAGDYSVQWRVVSADSHPIEGTFPFTTTGTGTGTQSTPDAGPESSAEEEETVTASATDESLGSPIIVILAVVVLGLLGIGALIVVTRRNLKATRH
jgi:methionine-rich copper-binding protein CopC